MDLRLLEFHLLKWAYINARIEQDGINLYVAIQEWNKLVKNV